MNEHPFEVIERVCITNPSHYHFLLMQARDTKSGETVWIVGDDQDFSIARADFVRNHQVSYKDVLIQEFSYRDQSPESVGSWRPLVEELVKFTLEKFREHDGLVHIYPQWVPAEVSLPLPREELLCSADHIIFRKDGTMDVVPPSAESGSKPSGQACGKEEC